MITTARHSVCRALLVLPWVVAGCAAPDRASSTDNGAHGDDGPTGNGPDLRGEPASIDGTIIDGVTVSGTVDRCGDGALSGRTDRSLLVDPGAPDHVWVGVEGLGLFRSTDGGATWKRAVSGMKAHVVSGTRDLCFDRFSSAAIDPFDFHHLCIGVLGSPGTLSDPLAAANGVYCSRDDGEHWQQRVSTSMNTAVCSLAMDAENPGLLWAGVAGTAGAGGHYFQNVGVLYLNLDDGSHWPELGFGGGFVRGMSLAALALSPTPHGRIYAAAPVLDEAAAGGATMADDQFGLLSSSDGGGSWGWMTRGMDARATSRAITRIALSPSGSGMLLATANEPPAPGPYLYFSDDGGDSFHEPGLPAGTALDIFAFDPSDPAGRHALGIHSHSRDVLESFDGGRSWHGFGGQLPGDTAGNPVVVSHIVWTSDPRVIYVSGSAGSVYRSADIGRSWQRVLSQ